MKNQLEITELDGVNGYLVRSDSGGSYTVTEQSAQYHHEYDDEMMAVWGCDCAAAKHGKSCKHVAAVIALRSQD